MRICFLTQNLNTKDGGGRLAFDFISNFKNSAYNILVLTSDDLLKKPFINFFKIRNQFKDSDIIHAIDIWPNGFYARLISLGLRKPIIITAMGTYSVAPFYSWRRIFASWVSRNSELIAISDHTKNEIKKVMPKVKINVITPGFNLDFWSGDQSVNNEEILQYKPYILSVGALKLRKGYHNSIKAFSIIAKKFPELNYVIIGQGEKSDYAKELKKLVKEKGLENRIFFISSGVDDKQLLGFYKNTELFILTPIEEGHHFEGFGIVYLEAAASGLPIVAVYKSGATSATKEGYNSILVPPNNPMATADAILKIFEDQELKLKFSTNGREWVKNFNQDEITKKYIEIYNAYVKHN